jgi:putative transposase
MTNRRGVDLSPVIRITTSESFPFNWRWGELDIKRKRFIEEQIIKALQQQEAGVKVQDICREIGIVEQTFYRWKSKYGGLDVSEAKRLRTLKEENSRQNKLLADTMLQYMAIKDALSKKWWSQPSVRKWSDTGWSRVGWVNGRHARWPVSADPA